MLEAYLHAVFGYPDLFGYGLVAEPLAEQSNRLALRGRKLRLLAPRLVDRLDVVGDKGSALRDGAHCLDDVLRIAVL